MPWNWPLSAEERRAAVLTARGVWLRELAEDRTVPLTPLERVTLRLVADKLGVIVRELQQGGPCEPSRS